MSTSLDSLERELQQLAAFESRDPFIRSRLKGWQGTMLIEVTTAEGQVVPFSLVYDDHGQVTVERGKRDERECAVILTTSPEVLCGLLREEIGQRAAYDSGQLRIKKGSLVDLVRLRSMFTRYSKAQRQGRLAITKVEDR